MYESGLTKRCNTFFKPYYAPYAPPPPPMVLLCCFKMVCSRKMKLSDLVSTYEPSEYVAIETLLSRGVPCLFSKL